MADVDVGQLANSLGSTLQLFFQERRRRAGEVKADERFEKQHELFLQSRELDRQREARLATESQNRIANQKIDRERAQMAMFVNMAQESGVEIAMKVARSMGASPEQLEALSTLVGIKAASRGPVSSTSIFQARVQEGASVKKALEDAANPSGIDFDEPRADPDKLDPLVFRMILEGRLTPDEATVIDSLKDGTFDSQPVEIQALLPGILAKLKEGAEQPGTVDTKRVNELLSVEKKIADLELAGRDTSELIVIRNRLVDELAAISSGLLTDEERIRIRQEQATTAKERETTEQRQRAKTQIQALEPTSALAEKAAGARERIGQGGGSIADAFEALIATPAASLGSAIEKIFLPQAFRNVQTGQIIQVRGDTNLEGLKRAEEAGLIEAIPRGEAARLLRREGPQPIPSPRLTLDDFRGSAVGGRR